MTTDCLVDADVLVSCQDHYRIRTFTRAAVDIGLPERLIAKPEELERSERVFREHFFHSTLAWFRGGDIHKQVDIRDVKAEERSWPGRLQATWPRGTAAG